MIQRGEETDLSTEQECREKEPSLGEGAHFVSEIWGAGVSSRGTSFISDRSLGLCAEPWLSAVARDICMDIAGVVLHRALF